MFTDRDPADRGRRIDQRQAGDGGIEPPGDLLLELHADGEIDLRAGDGCNLPRRRFEGVGILAPGDQDSRDHMVAADLVAQPFLGRDRDGDLKRGRHRRRGQGEQEGQDQKSGSQLRCCHAVSCLLQIVSMTVIADEMHGMTLVASLQGMHSEKMFPVPALLIVEDPGTLAQRAVPIEGGEERPPDGTRTCW